eukprot:scaffold76459_cov76-Phaeocystis_antarctica.AAC.4
MLLSPLTAHARTRAPGVRGRFVLRGVGEKLPHSTYALQYWYAPYASYTPVGFQCLKSLVYATDNSRCVLRSPTLQEAQQRFAPWIPHGPQDDSARGCQRNRQDCARYAPESAPEGEGKQHDDRVELHGATKHFGLDQIANRRVHEEWQQKCKGADPDTDGRVEQDQWHGQERCKDGPDIGHEIGHKCDQPDEEGQIELQQREDQSDERAHAHAHCGLEHHVAAHLPIDLCLHELVGSLQPIR